MKNVIKLFFFFGIMLTLSNCDDQVEWRQPNIQQVPVFSITDIHTVVDDNPEFNQKGLNISYLPFAINIYKEKELIINYSTPVNTTAHDPMDFTNTSTDLTYDMAYSTYDSSSDEIQDKTETFDYIINYDRTATEPLFGVTINMTTVTTTITNTIDNDIEGTVITSDFEEDPAENPNDRAMTDAVITIETVIDINTEETTRTRTRVSTVNYRVLMAEEQVYN